MNGFDQLDIAVRAYTENPKKKPFSNRRAEKSLDESSEKALIFDCETTIDAGQSLRFGFFQVRKGGALEREGIFYEPDALSDDELRTLESFAASNRLELITAYEFRRDVFLPIGYDERGLIIGFNLPFDISRIAISHGIARGSMRGGFSFRLSKDRRTPSVRVKHLSRRAALIDFAAPGLQETPRGQRKRGMKTARHRGFFVDVKTLAAALTPHKGSLASLCAFLKTKTRKRETDEHGATISPDYLAYGRDDVQATWECFDELAKRYAAHGLSKPIHRILSEASVGKTYLEEMQVLPLLAKQPEFPRSVFGKIMSAYHGGRCEVRIRREIRRVLYCDFKSMYPTVNALMRLWPFVIAKKITMRDATDEVRRFLTAVTLDDFQSKKTWEKLAIIVRIRPDGDLFPVRAKYDGRSYTTGLNVLTSERPLYFTLADCIAAKLLSGKTPEIEEAIRFEASEPQSGLKPINLFGKPAYRVDPTCDDVFSRFVDLRDEAKANGDPVQQAIKIIANATSYGIFIEVIRDDAPKPEPLDVYGPDGEHYSIRSTALEQPGRYFNPLLGALITGAARLMLALAERITLNAGLEWVFCDTDSLAIARPEGMDEKDFLTRAQSVIDWFGPLSPYRKSGSIFQTEDINFDTGNGDNIMPLYAFAISAKRYALFNIDHRGDPVIRKASAHGLGHLLAPYDETDALPNITAPSVSLHEVGVRRWQFDLWRKIIAAALGGDPDCVDLSDHFAFDQPALSQYAATSPAILGWFDQWNASRSYAAQVKPFGFMTAFQARKGLWADFDTEPVEGPQGRGRPKAKAAFAPVAPFNKEPEKALAEAFDRNTGESVPENLLKTYREALCQYHIASEAKFRNGRFYDRGETIRRCVKAKRITLIGKEGNNIERDGLGMPYTTIKLDNQRYAEKLERRSN